MSHIRTTLRAALVQLLKDADTDAGDNVYPNRQTATWTSELPAIFVFTKDEQANQRALNSSQSIRALQLIFELRVFANDTTDDDLDTLAKQVEDVIAVADISGTLGRPIYKTTTVELDSNGETQSGVLQLTFEIQYIQ